MEETIKTYQKLIGELPKLNGQLLLYILDLLAVFAENSTANLMPATNLAAIFQPGLISHPDHDMDPQEYKVSQEVLIFLIEHQDRFLPNQAVRRDPLLSKPAVKPAPPAKYSGTHLSTSAPLPQEIKIPRRRTTPRRTEASPIFMSGKVLRRHRSSRTPQSPKLVVDDTEPRRVSEGNEPSSPIGEEDEGPPTTDSKSRRKSSPQRLVRSASFEAGRDDGK
jgi:RhoGAP domain